MPKEWETEVRMKKAVYKRTNQKTSMTPCWIWSLYIYSLDGAISYYLGTEDIPTKHVVLIRYILKLPWQFLYNNTYKGTYRMERLHENLHVMWRSCE